MPPPAEHAATSPALAELHSFVLWMTAPCALCPNTNPLPRSAQLWGSEGDAPTLMVDVDLEFYLRFVLSWT